MDYRRQLAHSRALECEHKRKQLRGSGAKEEILSVLGSVPAPVMDILAPPIPTSKEEWETIGNVLTEVFTGKTDMYKGVRRFTPEELAKGRKYGLIKQGLKGVYFLNSAGEEINRVADEFAKQTPEMRKNELRALLSKTATSRLEDVFGEYVNKIAQTRTIADLKI